MADLTEEQKIATLSAQVATLTQEKATASEQIKSLTLAKDTAEKALSDAQAQIKLVSAAKDAAEKSNEDAAKIVTDLKTQLAEKQSGVIQLPVVKVGADTYELVGGSFMFDGKEVTHELLKEDSKLVAKLIKERVGNLRKLEK